MRRADPDSGAVERALIGPIFGMAVCLFVWAALLTFDAGDWPSPHQYPHNDPPANACGRAGAVISYYLLYYLGDGVYPLALFGTLAAGMWIVHGRVAQLIQRAFGLALLVGGTAAAVHLVSRPGSGALPEGNGGVVGIALGDLVRNSFSNLGAVVVLGYALLVGLVLVAEGWVLRAPAAIRKVGLASRSAFASARQATTAAVAAAGGPQAVTAANSAESRSRTQTDDGPAVAVVEAPAKARPSKRRKKTQEDEEEDESLDEVEDDLEDAEYEYEEDEDEEDEEEEDEEDEVDSAGAKDVSPLIIKHFQRKPEQAPEPYPREIEDWTFPPLSLLEDPEYNFSAHQESQVRAKAKILERTLEEFRLQARVVEIDTGPVITMYELELAPGIKVSQIASLSNDIARALKAPAVRVVAPLPGKNTVGIEVPNQEKEKVRLKELITATGKSARDMALPLFIGKDASGSPLIGNLAKMPHLLIAGTTGSGKSVCINSIIMSLLMTQRPDWCKLILVDPKMVEMSQFKEVPHLMCPIVTDLKRAESILEWAVTKMEERYELLSEAGVRNIATFNSLGKDKIYERFSPASDEEKQRIPTHLPYVVIIIDELADLMMTSAKEVEHHLSRLAQKSRAVGIHIVVATQRPEAKVVTGLIKSNLPCRVAFRVASRMDSRIVLDQNGAEVLMGQGDMLFLPPGSAKLIRAQGTFLEDAELHAVIDHLAERSQPEFHPELIRMHSANLAGDGERDPLFEQAVRVVLQSKRGSVSLLQRKLTIGYSRASRLIEQMAEAGIVGMYKGSQAREVSMTLDEWDALQEQMARELTEGYAADEDVEAQDDSEAVPDLSDNHDILG
ncbi:MAG: DNA translocase FtsK [Phycisphaerae bacterium]